MPSRNAIVSKDKLRLITLELTWLKREPDVLSVPERRLKTNMDTRGLFPGRFGSPVPWKAAAPYPWRMSHIWRHDLIIPDTLARIIRHVRLSHWNRDFVTTRGRNYTFYSAAPCLRNFDTNSASRKRWPNLSKLFSITFLMSWPSLCVFSDC